MENKKIKNSWLWSIAAIVTIVAIALSVWLVPPYFEMQSFNRLTGGDVTYWEAV